jgi:hypothetical protein
MAARTRGIAVATMVMTMGVITLGGCSNGADTASPDDAGTTSTSSATDASETPAAEQPPTESPPADANADAGAVPPACDLVSTEELSAHLGVDVGVGEESSVSPQRSVCFYPTGVITAVEVAENYEASRAVIEEMGSTTEDIPGVGRGAFYDANGQVIVLGERYFVAVAAYPPDRGRLTEAAKVLLAAAGG